MSGFLRSRWLFGGARGVLRSCCCGNRKSCCSLKARFVSFIPRKVTCACHSVSSAGHTQRFLNTSAFLLRDKNPDYDHLNVANGNQSGISLNSKNEKTCVNAASHSEIVSDEPSDSNDVSLADPEPLIIEAFTDVFEKSLPKCPGCGAIFQSDDPEKLGYVLPSKNPTAGFLDKDPDIVASKNLVCQKCFNLKHYNKPFPAKFSRDEILEYLRHLKRRKGLILYVVDMLDLPGSLFPSLLDTVGDAKRIIVVGNKLDMLPVDGHTGKQEEHMRNVLSSLCKTHGLSGANVKSVCLISAKSGFGILQLASKILEHWDHKGDFYLIGCSNAGKTTLFNLLLDLFSVHKKADLLQRATVSLWPCTTQRLLRFPIGHWMLKRLCRRLREGVQTPDLDDTEIDLDNEIIERELTNYTEVTRTKKGKLVPLETMQSGGEASNLAVLKPSFVMVEHDKPRTWLYDTPGIISEKQITNMLTMEELKLLNPTLWLVPRTFILKPGECMLLGGLGRLDYLEIKRHKANASDDEWETVTQAAQSVFFTVFTSPEVPVHVCKVASADAVYAKHAGQELLKIPCGGKERMKTFPELKSCDFAVKGVGLERSAADVVLSNLGWVAVTARVGSLVTVQAHSPNGIGLDIREPLCPTCVTKRGKRGVRYQGYARIGQYQSTRRQHPQFVPLARGEHWGEKKWMQEIKRKRKEQRFLLKAEKWTKDTEKSFLGRSAISNPPQIPGAVGIAPPRRRLKSGPKV